MRASPQLFPPFHIIPSLTHIKDGREYSIVQLLLNPSSLHVLTLAQINWILLISRQGKVRLAKWFTTLGPKAKAKITKDVTQLVLARRVSKALLYASVKKQPG